jgi:hypothetical protein
MRFAGKRRPRMPVNCLSGRGKAPACKPQARRWLTQRVASGSPLATIYIGLLDVYGIFEMVNDGVVNTAVVFTASPTLRNRASYRCAWLLFLSWIDGPELQHLAFLRRLAPICGSAPHDRG